MTREKRIRRRLRNDASVANTSFSGVKIRIVQNVFPRETLKYEANDFIGLL
jgi:hypothetical protein